MIRETGEYADFGDDDGDPTEVPSLNGSTPWRLAGIPCWRVFAGRSEDEGRSSQILSTIQTKPPVFPAVDRFLSEPESVAPPGLKEFFIAKAEECQLSDCIPHAIVKIYASAIQHECVNPYSFFSMFSISVQREGCSWRCEQWKCVGIHHPTSQPR